LLSVLNIEYNDLLLIDCGVKKTYLLVGYVCHMANVYWGPSDCRYHRIVGHFAWANSHRRVLHRIKPLERRFPEGKLTCAQSQKKTIHA
jgi:hypothetical protein